MLDDKGQAGWKLAKYLDMADSNLNPLLKRLERIGLIFQGEARKAKRKHMKDGDYKEFPYYLRKNLDALRTMIKEIAKARTSEKWFIFRFFARSNYLDSMRTKFGRENVDETLKDELVKSYKAPFPDIMEIINPQWDLLELSPDPETEPIRFWYYYGRHPLGPNW